MVLTGCAGPNFNINLPVDGLKNPIEGGNGREVLVVIPFQDNRTKNDYCGGVHWALGGNGSCDIEPGEWLARLLVDELRASGFKVLYTNEPHGPSALKIEGSLLRLFVEPLQGMWTSTHEADLHVKLFASTENGLVAERTFYVKGIKKGIPNAFYIGNSLMPISLRRASNQLLTDMVESIFYLMNKYPNIGMAHDKLQEAKNLSSGVGDE